ncbi:MAG: restriction endonuclease subunit S [Nitrospirae bacterium]|nr:restriction endonuclease subunit S [Nitrospirota bacterium]
MAGDWSTVTFDEIITVKHGYAFPGENIREEPLGDILLTPGNFEIGGGFKADKFKYFDGEVPDEYVLEEGDLLVTMTDLSKQSDTLGFPALVPKAGSARRYLHNQRLGKILVKPNAEVDKRFIYYLLCSAEYRHEVLASATGTSIKHTSPSRILAYKARLPSLVEQKSISHILGTLDDKIELNRKMNQTLEAMAQAIFKSWFADFDPVRAIAEGRDPGLPRDLAELFPDSFEDSELGAIPKGWRVGIVDEEFNLTMGQSPPGETYNDTGEGLPFFQGCTDFGFRFPSRRVYCTAPTRYADKGDTLISVRAPVGDVNMAAEKCCIGRGVAAAKHKSGSRSYTFYFMKSIDEVFAHFEAEGTVFGSISKKDFHNIQCIISPAEVITAFEHLAFSIDEQIANNEQQSGTLIALRDTLLPKLLSGDLKVRT